MPDQRKQDEKRRRVAMRIEASRTEVTSITQTTRNGSKSGLAGRLVMVSLMLFCLVAGQATHCQQTNATNKNPLLQQLSAIGLTVEPIEAASNADHYETLSSSMLKTYIRTNNMRAYHMDLHSYRPEAKYAGDPTFVDSKNPAHWQRCRRHLDEYDALLKSFNELDPVIARNSLDSLRLADSFGRPESGVLSGNQFWLGAYDSCLDFELDETASSEAIKSQYCLGVSQFPNWNPQDSKTSIKVGLCLPETCTSSMLNEDRQLFNTVETMMKYQFGEKQPFSRLKLRQVYCLPHATSQIRQYSISAILFFLFTGSFVLACLIATAVEVMDTKSINRDFRHEDRNWRHIMIESFSIKRNLNKFMSIREEPAAKQAEVDEAEDAFDRSTFLNSMTGLKCIGLCWIICAHTFLVGPIPSKNLIEIDKLTKTYLADIYLTAHLMVDTFFALSGILASYFIFKEGIHNIKTKNWIILTVHRYWRLTPIYFICYWFTKSVGVLLNTGPTWDYMTAEQSPRLNCARESWFDALLHLSDFKSPKEHCVPFAWFIANGIKFWMVTPIFLTLINKSVRRGYVLTGATILASMVLVGNLASRSNVDMKSVIEFKPESAENMLNNMDEIYTRPYSRIGAYLVGLLAGHLIYLIDTNQMQIKLSKSAKITAWTLFSVIVVLLTFVLKIANGIKLDEEAIPIVFSICSAVIRPLWALCTCWLVFALAHGQIKPVARFLSANCWRLLVKLSFCAYLVQGEVIAHLFLSKSTSSTFTYNDMISQSIVTIALTIAVSFIMVLVLEYPLIGIEELLLPKRRKETLKPTSDDGAKTQDVRLKNE